MADMHTTIPSHRGLPVTRTRRTILLAVVATCALAMASYLALGNRGGSQLGASLTGSGMTRADCFTQQRTGRLTPECRGMLFNNFYTATAIAVATSDPNAPTPTPKSPMGAKCLNNDQCATGNCVMGEDPTTPSRLIGTCGCRARPACLDAQPACALPETPDMCVCGNGMCEAGEKTSCRQDCLAGNDGPSCATCLRQGSGFLCKGGFTGGTFCNSENGGPGADFTCVACSDQPARCAPEGQACSTQADCGTCGATCQGQGMTASIPPHIIGGTCVYPRVSGSPLPMCDHAAPPEGCRYVPGPDYDPVTTCGLELKCDPDFPGPDSDGFRLTLPATIRVGDKADLKLCGGSTSVPFLGWATITVDAGPTADVPTYFSYDFTAEDRGCRTFPAAIQPIREGTLKVTAENLHFSDLEDGAATITTTLTRRVTAAGSLPSECAEKPGDVTCDTVVGIADLAQVSDLLVGRSVLDPATIAYKNADMDKNGVVDIADLAQLSRLISSLPSPQ